MALQHEKIGLAVISQENWSRLGDLANFRVSLKNGISSFHVTSVTRCNIFSTLVPSKLQRDTAHSVESRSNGIGEHRHVFHFVTKANRERARASRDIRHEHDDSVVQQVGASRSLVDVENEPFFIRSLCKYGKEYRSSRDVYTLFAYLIRTIAIVINVKNDRPRYAVNTLQIFLSSH